MTERVIRSWWLVKQRNDVAMSVRCQYPVPNLIWPWMLLRHKARTNKQTFFGPIRCFCGSSCFQLLMRLLAVKQGDPDERMAVPGLHGVWGLREAARRGPPHPVRRLWHLLPHLLPRSPARPCAHRHLEVQMVSPTCYCLSMWLMRFVWHLGKYLMWFMHVLDILGTRRDGRMSRESHFGRSGNSDLADSSPGQVKAMT